MPVRDWKRCWGDAWPVALILIPGLLGTRPDGEERFAWSREPDVYAYGLVVFVALWITLLRRRPGVTLVCCGAAVVVYLLAGYPFGPILIVVPVAAGGGAVAWPLRRALICNAALGLAVGVAGGIRFGTELAEGHGLPLLGWLGGLFAAVAVSTAIGAANRIRRESAAGLRAVEARRAVSEERLRMAQELHDSVGHGLAVIAMQAGIALHVLDRNPANARESIEAIRTVSRESLDGLRAELDVLRTPAVDSAPRHPAPGLAEVDALLDRIRAGGVEVVADIRSGDLPPEVDVAVYRILRESLTNVLLHAGATLATVRVHRTGDDVLIDVTDNGSVSTAPARAQGRRGTGIAGLRARAEVLDGELEAGPHSGGGFTLRARLPLGGRPYPADVS